MVLYHHWSSLIWHEEEGFPSNVGLSKKPKLTTSATLGLGKNCPHNKRIILLWTKLVVLYHHWPSLIWHEEEGFPSNVGLSKKPKMTASATLGLGKNCPHNKRILLLWTKLVILYHHWSSLIWHEEEGFPSNVGLSKKSKMTASATLGLGKNCPHNILN